MNIEPVTYMSSSPGFSTEKANLDHVHQLGTFPRCCVYRTANLTVPHNSWTFVDMDAGEDFDTDNMHSLTTNPSRIDIPLTGVWDVGYEAYTPNFATGSYCLFTVWVNRTGGIGPLRGGSYLLGANYLGGSKDVQLSKGSYIELGAYQLTGADITMAGTAFRLWATFKGI